MGEEEMKQLVAKIRKEKAELAGPALEVSSYQQGYWTGYFAALNEILRELNKPTYTLCEFAERG